MSKPRPQPPYARLNQPPRSPHGRNRQTPSKNHSDPLDGASASAGGAAAKLASGTVGALWRTINQPVNPIDPGASPLTMADWTKIMDQSMLNMLMQQNPFLYYGIDPAASPPPIPYTGIHSGELLGHRAWLVTDTLDLCSLAHYFVWKPKATIEGDINEVVYRSVTGRFPDRFGGVYAYSSFDHLRDDEVIETLKNRHKFPQRQQIDRHGTLHCSCFLCNRAGNRYYVNYLGLAFGTVKLWGETVEHEKGYRASFAKLTSIDGFIGVEGFDLAKLRGKYLP